MERGDEALDLLLHVRPGEQAEVVEQLLGAAVELLVEAVDELLGVDAAAVPLAVGAAQLDAPALAARPGPSRSGRRGREAQLGQTCRPSARLPVDAARGEPVRKSLAPTGAEPSRSFVVCSWATAPISAVAVRSL